MDVLGCFGRAGRPAVCGTSMTYVCLLSVPNRKVTRHVIISQNYTNAFVFFQKVNRLQPDGKVTRAVCVCVCDDDDAEGRI